MIFYILEYNWPNHLDQFNSGFSQYPAQYNPFPNHPGNGNYNFHAFGAYNSYNNNWIQVSSIFNEVPDAPNWRILALEKRLRETERS